MGDKGIAVVLLSGGMDSLTTLGIAIEEGYEPAVFHLNYGQKSEEAELRAFNKIAQFYAIPDERKIVAHTNCFTLIGGSSLIDPHMKVPKADLKHTKIPSTYVPFRNGILLSMAVSWAEKIGATAIYFGAVSADSSGYPDCRSEFIAEFLKAAKSGTATLKDLIIRAPLVDLRKSQIVAIASKLGLPLHYSWSCYERNDLACGECDSCALRLRAFSEIGSTDPIVYAKFSKGEAVTTVEKLSRLRHLLAALTRQ
jgi:7-cyano-7-deazaguanine synthase